MSAPMSAHELTTQLKKWGVGYREYGNWSDHNRAGHGGWGTMNGFMWHHTGSDGTDQRSYLYNGDASLPGPLCQFHIDSAGLVWLIGWGRANHAGGGDPAVLAHVVAENYNGVLHPHYHEGENGSVDGNAHFYGVEIGYAGTHGMSHAQYVSALKLSAAVCDFHGWTEKSVIGHGEWSDWKWDPGYAKGKIMDMNAVRNDVHDLLHPAKKPAEKKSSPKTLTVVVKSGDTLWKLAEKYLGDGNKWPELVEANADVMLRVGDVIKIPR